MHTTFVLTSGCLVEIKLGSDAARKQQLEERRAQAQHAEHLEQP